MKREKWITIFAIVLALLSTARMVGKFLPFSFFPRFARTLSISPNPSPLSTVRTWQGVESRGTDIVCENQDGEFKTVRWDHNVMSRIEAPVRVRAHFSGVLNLFAEEEPQAGRALLERIFCHEGLFKSAVGCVGELRSVELRFYSYRNEEDRSRRNYKLLCARETP